jgi:hypothetical protein
VPARPQRVPLDDPEWFSVLVRDALSENSALPRPIRTAELGREVEDRLWSSGVLLGAGPAEPRIQTQTDAEAAFVQLTRFMLQQVAALVRSSVPAGTTPQLVRWRLSALIAAFIGEHGVASVFEEALQETPLPASDEKRLLGIIGAQLQRRAYLLGNPPDGLPLHGGIASLEARSFVRLAAGWLANGRGLRARSEAYATRHSAVKALYAELVAGVFAATDALAPGQSSPWLRMAGRQVRALSLLPEDRRTALDGLRTPRSPVDLLREVPPRTRKLLLEQLVLAALLVHRWTPEVRAQFVDSAAELHLPAKQIEAVEACAAAFLLEHREAALALSRAGRETAWDHVLQETTDSFHEAADAVAAEIRATGELGGLLARMARGEALSPDERHRMRQQLVDLAKVVPSLAIFAAPGGMLLLPLVFKLLPFDMRPTAFQGRAATPPPPARKRRSSDAA